MHLYFTPSSYCFRMNSSDDEKDDMDTKDRGRSRSRSTSTSRSSSSGEDTKAGEAAQELKQVADDTKENTSDEATGQDEDSDDDADANEHVGHTHEEIDQLFSRHND